MLLFLSLALFAFFPASVLTMNHASMKMHTFAHGSITGKSISAHAPNTDSDQCTTFHLNILQTICTALPQFSDVLIFAFTILLLSYVASVATKQNLDYFNRLILFKFQRLKPISHDSFMAQLGNWLIIIQKKTPVYVSIIA